MDIALTILIWKLKSFWATWKRKIQFSPVYTNKLDPVWLRGPCSPELQLLPERGKSKILWICQSMTHDYRAHIEDSAEKTCAMLNSMYSILLNSILFSIAPDPSKQHQLVDSKVSWTDLRTQRANAAPSSTSSHPEPPWEEVVSCLCPAVWPRKPENTRCMSN